MASELKAQVEEQLGLLETKVERAYDVSQNNERNIIAKKLEEMAKNIKEILARHIMNNEYVTLTKIIDIINDEIEDVIIHIIGSARKQEKQEAMYKVSHLYSKDMEEIINGLDKVKTMYVAEARNCVAPIDNAFNEIVSVYMENLQGFKGTVSQQVIDKVVYEIRKCANGIQEAHSEQTYSIENQIITNIEKMVKTLATIKEKSVTETKQIRIKGGVTNSQNGKFSLSDIIAEKTEIVTDIPKRTSLQEFWD